MYFKKVNTPLQKLIFIKYDQSIGNFKKEILYLYGQQGATKYLEKKHPV